MNKPTFVPSLPNWRDERFLFQLSFSVLIVHSIFFRGFGKSFDQFLVTICTCFFLDCFYQWLFNPGRFFLPLSGAVTPFGLYLYNDSTGLFFYFLGGVFAISSKHLIQIQGRQIFNPNNFGLIMLLTAFPEYVSDTATRWGGHTVWTFIIMALGIALSVRAKRFMCSLGYAAFFAFFAYVRAWIAGEAFLNSLAPLLGPAIQVFIFFMITDPKTSPDRAWHQVVYGGAIAAMENILRYYEIKSPYLYGLFLVLAIMGVLRHFNWIQKSEFHWSGEKRIS